MIIVVIDANVLISWSKEPVGSDTVERLSHLTAELARSNGRLVIPAPALAEFLVKIGDAASWFDALSNKRAVRVAPFDRRAAFEHSIITRHFAARARTRAPRTNERHIVKFDRQIVAIARVERADTVVSGDQQVRAESIEFGMRGIRIEDLPLPPSAMQRSLDLTSPGADTATPAATPAGQATGSPAAAPVAGLPAAGSAEDGSHTGA